MKTFKSFSFFRSTLISFTLCVLLLIPCYEWLDPAIAFWVETHHLKRFLVLEYCTYLANLTVWIVSLYYLYFAASFALHTEDPTLTKDFPQSKWPFLNVANSVAIAIFMKNAFKFIFGRYWPSTWVNNNPSLIHDHAYGFHFFHSGQAFQSFPSGHTTIVIAAATSIWLTYPKGIWHWLSLLAGIGVIIGLIGENYHFLGDCIAGAWVGATVAIYVTTYTRNSIPSFLKAKINNR